MRHLDIGAQARDVIFLHRTAHETRGSKLMRCDQLAGFARELLPQRRFDVAALPDEASAAEQAALLARVTDRHVILLKRADLSWPQSFCDGLAGRAATISVDYVDAPLDPVPNLPIALHIAASEPCVERLAGRGQVVLLPHHADPRLFRPDRSWEQRMTMLYIGRISHAVLPDPCPPDFLLYPYRSGPLDATALGVMGTHNAHFAVRPADDGRRIPPPTKIANAAAVGAVVLASRSDPAARMLLGADYPFWTEGTTADAIRVGITQMRDGFGGADWAKARAIMDEIAQTHSPLAVVRGFSALLDRLDAFAGSFPSK